MRKYWALKTREDIDPEHGDYHPCWENFKSEGVIAIGWKLSPEFHKSRSILEDVAFDDLVKDLKSTSYHERTPRADRQAKIAANTILKFTNEVSVGDRVLLCQGYAANQRKDVYIYGFAQVDGPTKYDEDSDWWSFKRKAKIGFIIEAEVTKGFLAEILKKGSLRQTLHKIDIDESGFDQLRERLVALVSGRRGKQEQWG